MNKSKPDNKQRKDTLVENEAKNGESKEIKASRTVLKEEESGTKEQDHGRKAHEASLKIAVEQNADYFERLQDLSKKYGSNKTYPTANAEAAPERRDFVTAVLDIWPDIVARLKGLWDASKTLNESLWTDNTEIDGDLYSMSNPRDHLQVAYKWLNTRGAAVIVALGDHRWRLKVELDVRDRQVRISGGCELGPQLGDSESFPLPEGREDLLDNLEKRCEQLWEAVLAVH